MRSKRIGILSGVAALALVLGTAAQAQDVEKKVEVKIKKVAQCEEGEDCTSHRVMFVGDDGEVTELHGASGSQEGVHWVSAGQDGEAHEKVIVIGGDEGGEHALWLGEDGNEFHFGPDEMANAVFFGGVHGRGYLGVQLTELTPELRAHFGVPEDEGVMVSKVVEDGPAWQAGVRVGDIIGQVDGSTIGSSLSLQKTIAAIEPGETAALQVWRDGGIETLSATIAEREMPDMPMVRKLRVRCEDGEECEERHALVEVIGGHDAAFGHDFDCGDVEDCMIQVNCSDDGDCVCNVNGAEQDCESLPNVFVHRLHRDKE